MYYPASQIQTNLYTNGGEYSIKSTNQNYIGYYHKTSFGTFFSGKTPNDINIQELIKIEESPNSNLTSEAFIYNNTSNDASIIEYNKLNSNLNKSFIVPNSFNPIPTQEEYSLGEFTRYFCKKTNEIIYMEISKSTFDKLVDKDPSYLWQLYIPFSYKWRISGNKEDIYRINKNVTEYMSKSYNLPMFNKFLKENYLKFYK